MKRPRWICAVAFVSVLALWGSVAGTALHAQDPPGALTARGADAQVTLTWTPSTGLDDDETLVGYRVYRDENPIPDVPPSDVAPLQLAEIADPPETAYVDTDVANGTTYYYRVTALVLEQDDSQADETEFSNQASVTPSPAPVIDIETPEIPASSPVSEGNDVEVRAEVTDPEGVAAVRLLYRRAGEPAFVTTVMAANGDDYTALVPGAVTGDRGIEFAVEAEDTGGSTRRAPATGVYSIRVQVAGGAFTQRGGTEASAFRMVTLPLVLNDDRIADVFVDDLGAYDDAVWRLFGVGDGALDDASDYVERRTTSDATAPGDAFWLITRDNAEIDVGQGVTVRTDRPFEIPLNAGWNLVGHPFAFTVPLNAISVAGASDALGDVFAFDGAFVPLSSGDGWTPFSGYLVRLADGGAGTLVVDPRAETGAETLRAATQRSASFDWSLSVRVDGAGATDRFNEMAVSAGARSGVDGLDGHEPPPIGAYVSAAFLPDDTGQTRLWRDVRPSTGALQRWTLQVTSAATGALALSVDGLGTLPPGWSVILVDDALGVTQDLRRRSTYRFEAPRTDTDRRFTFLVGPSADVRAAVGEETERTALAAPVPHPVRDVATIRYTLAETRPVRVEVFDLLGRRVTTLVDAPTQSAGTHVQTWDLRGRGGRLGTGTYFVRLTAGDVVQTQRLVVVR